MKTITAPLFKQILKKIYRYHFDGHTANGKPSILVLGPPGVGKSTSVREAAQELAKELGLEFVVYSDDLLGKILERPENYFVLFDFTTTTLLPEDITGIPRVARAGDEDVSGGAEYVAYRHPGWVEAARRVRGIIFLDEMSDVRDEHLRSALRRLVYDRLAGYVRIGDGVMIVAAGNTVEHSSTANEYEGPARRRYFTFWMAEPELHVWAEWMDMKYPGMWYKETYAYLSVNINDFGPPKVLDDGYGGYPCPASWTELALALTSNPFERWSVEEIRALSISKLGEGTGERFATFVTEKYPTPEELLKNPDLAARIDKIDKLIKAALTFGAWMGSEYAKRGELPEKKKVKKILLGFLKSAKRSREVVTQVVIRGIDDVDLREEVALYISETLKVKEYGDAFEELSRLLEKAGMTMKKY